MSEKDPHRYDDMLDLPHFVSKNRRHMSNYDRAAQFAPFDALTGYDEAIEETGRTTENEVVLGENEIQILDRKFQILKKHLSSKPVVRIKYFVPDLYKDGGCYKEEEIVLRRIDLNERVIYSQDQRRFEMDYIVSIESDLFEGYEW